MTDFPLQVVSLQSVYEFVRPADQQQRMWDLGMQLAHGQVITFRIHLPPGFPRTPPRFQLLAPGKRVDHAMIDGGGFVKDSSGVTGWDPASTLLGPHVQQVYAFFAQRPPALRDAAAHAAPPVGTPTQPQHHGAGAPAAGMAAAAAAGFGRQPPSRASPPAQAPAPAAQQPRNPAAGSSSPSVGSSRLREAGQMVDALPYADRAAVRRDIGIALEVAPHLRPSIDSHFHNTGSDWIMDQLVKLEGTIATTFRGQTYHVPICIWFHRHHPSKAPSMFVQPQKGMQVDTSVGFAESDGTVLLARIHPWRSDPDAMRSMLLAASASSHTQGPDDTSISGSSAVGPFAQQPSAPSPTAFTSVSGYPSGEATNPLSSASGYPVPMLPPHNTAASAEAQAEGLAANAADAAAGPSAAASHGRANTVAVLPPIPAADASSVGSSQPQALSASATPAGSIAGADAGQERSPAAFAPAGSASAPTAAAVEDDEDAPDPFRDALGPDLGGSAGEAAAAADQDLLGLAEEAPSASGAAPPAVSVPTAAPEAGLGSADTPVVGDDESALPMRREAECCICTENVAVVAIIPCGHRCICEACKEQHAEGLGVCPICQTGLEGMLRVFDI